ncbi:SigB/SigF/SigG family RNA polymerase sigma factor [Streptomyces cyaneofuscatus]|uniref:SigB/SigF/SigG family RNA polymerase sigma factor n=1 Tax=Streptomyces cyaneofuscatus TaxID=66883 RepID=A0ABZ1EQ27_9ACTN|nr:SigB/SigF/SigG family RNA polymerase sigma factor [Streptomyces cyaneofuscatus]WSB06219.1 SigB/SigF/SigG family RNA polymerase sigma factor [Streptomyces cyaneofuscatus]WSD50247.1 SigB/SigF/SigG family RNA polymerase sigma factor [Streptomyces cyaneofuscatus]
MAEESRYADDPDTDADFRRLADLRDGPGKARLRGQIICAWLPMAHRLAARYRNRGETLEDLRQVAAIGLVNAVDRYDPDIGRAFAPFAVPTITGEIKRHFRDRMWSVHVPRRVQNLRNVVRLAGSELAAMGIAPSPARIAEHTGLSEEDVRHGSEALHGFSALSIDTETAPDGSELLLGDRLGVLDEAYDLVLDREAAKPGIRRLAEREKRVLYLRFFAGMTQSAIAAELGLSQMHISRLITESCRRIRESAREQPVEQNTLA